MCTVQCHILLFTAKTSVMIPLFHVTAKSLSEIVESDKRLLLTPRHWYCHDLNLHTFPYNYLARLQHNHAAQMMTATVPGITAYSIVCHISLWLLQHTLQYDCSNNEYSGTVLPLSFMWLFQQASLFLCWGRGTYPFVYPIKCHNKLASCWVQTKQTKSSYIHKK